jgi:hypothetical protein
MGELQRGFQGGLGDVLVEPPVEFLVETLVGA